MGIMGHKLMYSFAKETSSSIEELVNFVAGTQKTFSKLVTERGIRKVM